ncbi:hypothetical protein [Gordonia paraffinivorans]|uniref:hypothetical protein n=1 Tax=Gordonia paraffinivorans TaxID=175628 RepID=UPI0015E82537|nr:hypothetical protein [Gordonia paraffinivorans]
MLADNALDAQARHGTKHGFPTPLHRRIDSFSLDVNECWLIGRVHTLDEGVGICAALGRKLHPSST